jgi:uncharacterized membrane protein
MDLKKLKEDKYLLALLVVCLIFVFYWTSYQNYRYEKFISTYFDLGTEMNSMYWHVHGLQYYPNILDYIVFTNHISLFSLLIVPLFAIYQKPITLFLIQEIMLAITSIVIYFVSSDLLKSRKIGFALAFAFLINIAVINLVTAEFHMESFIALFYVLSFYFYMKDNKLYFAISYSLLLSLYDVMPPIGLSLLVALFAYEMFCNFKSKGVERDGMKKRLVILVIGIIITAIFLIFYTQVARFIESSYSTIPNNVIIPIQRLKSYISEQLSLVSANSATNFSSIQATSGTIMGLFIFFFGFGASSFFNPVISLILYSPWLLEVLVVHNLGFVVPIGQYYAYALSGSMVSAILGYMMISKSKIKLFGLDLHNLIKNEKLIAIYILFFAIIISSLLVPLLYGKYLSLNYAPKLNYTQINEALKFIPSNSTVMAQASIAPHLYYIHSLELFPTIKSGYYIISGVQVYWTKPNYIIIDNDLPVEEGEFVNSSFNISNYIKENYTISYNQSGLYIYKEIN